jgi:hypothetical protein
MIDSTHLRSYTKEVQRITSVDEQDAFGRASVDELEDIMI